MSGGYVGWVSMPKLWVYPGGWVCPGVGMFMGWMCPGVGISDGVGPPHPDMGYGWQTGATHPSGMLPCRNTNITPNICPFYILV